MSKIIELLRRVTGQKAVPDAATLRLAEEEANAALSGAEEALMRMERERADALLSGDDKAVERVEAQSVLMTRERDRARIAVTTLAMRAQQAEGREASVALDRQVAEARHAAERAAASVAIEYPAVAGALARLLERSDAADRLVREARHAAQVAGRTGDELRNVDELLHPPGVLVFAPVSGSVSLRPMDGFKGYGEAKRLFEGAGLASKVNGGVR